MNQSNLFVYDLSTQNHRVSSFFPDQHKVQHRKSKLRSMSSVLNKTPTVRLTRKGKQTFDFSTVGGLDHHLSVLKEVIIFPLIFSKLYLHFNIKAPRGVLFHGPPGKNNNKVIMKFENMFLGTGKTFVAGALVAELNKLGMGKVNFYHRKGADILDKWVGESERKLRELFEKVMLCKIFIVAIKF